MYNMDNMTIVCDTEIAEQIPIVRRQTNYTESEAKEKLILYGGDHIKVIKDYMGITEKKEPIIKSVNQEIYKQLRYKLDSSVKEYNEKQSESLANEFSQNKSK